MTSYVDDTNMICAVTLAMRVLALRNFEKEAKDNVLTYPYMGR